jgi:hypothetical protein
MMNSLEVAISENKAIQDKIIDVVADYDVEFASELDDLVEHKINVDDLDLDRLQIMIEKSWDGFEDYFVLYLDKRPIAKYWIERNLDSLKAEIHFEKV